jgi:protein SCO1/2
VFRLVDHRNETFRRKDLEGHTSLLFFGFTHCPDICPTTLALLAQISRDPQLSEVATLFVTVDPARDDQTVLRRYVDAFGGRFTGLRGEPPQLDPLMQTLGAASRVNQTPDGGYVVDHTATLFYLDAAGRLTAVFTPPFSLPALRADLATLTGG